MTPYDVITTVNTAASSYDLTDLETVKTELAIPDTDTSKDTWISQAITQVSIAIANYCQRVFPVETVTDTFYFNRRWRAHQRTDDRDILQLMRFPVTQVTSVVETLSDGTTNTLVLGTDYVRKDNVGQLIRLNSDTSFLGHWIGSIVVVQYSAGYAETPADLVDATLRTVTQRYAGRGRDAMLMEQDQPGPAGRKRFWVGTAPGQNGSFPPEIAGLLDNYRVPVLG